MNDTNETLQAELATSTREVTRQWWVVVLLGVAWLVYGFVVLSATTESVAAIAALFGVGLIVGGGCEFAVAAMVSDWKWVHIVFGILSIIAGIAAVAWPGSTVLVLASIVGWYLLFNGIFSTMLAISTRQDDDLWWLGLIVGLAQIAIAVWAVGYAGRSVALLIVWVGTALVARGVVNIFSGFALHGADKAVRNAVGPAT